MRNLLETEELTEVFEVFVTLPFVVTIDANGNVVQLVDASDSSTVAEYEYDPFGNVISSSGDMADENRYRFSTKYQDEVSGWLYYGYRYYAPEMGMGRWINRDPIGEEGGANLYAAMLNNPVDKWDNKGLLVLVLDVLENEAGTVFENVSTKKYATTIKNVDYFLKKLAAMSNENWKKAKASHRIKLNGEDFLGTKEELKQIALREKSSQYWFARKATYSQTLSKLKSLASFPNAKKYDYLAVATEGLINMDAGSVNISFADVERPQGNVTAEFAKTMAVFPGNKIIVSCFQTWKPGLKPASTYEGFIIKPAWGVARDARKVLEKGEVVTEPCTIQFKTARVLYYIGGKLQQ